MPDTTTVLATALPNLEDAVKYPGNLADAVREAALMLDREEHRYVERFVDCPNGCVYEGVMEPKRTAGPDDCDQCFLGSHEDEDAPQINPLIGALLLASASLEAVPAWVAPLVRFTLSDDQPLDLNVAYPERLRALLDPDVPAEPPPGHVYVVTRYGGHRHYARASRAADGRHYTACRTTSAWTLESWADTPDHPQGLTADVMAGLPVCPDCIKAVR